MLLNAEERHGHKYGQCERRRGRKRGSWRLEAGNDGAKAGCRHKQKERSQKAEIFLRKNLPAGIDGVRAIGKISKEDYEQVFVPLLDDARREGRHIRFLYQLGPEFEGFTPGAAWEDAKIGLHFLRLFDGCALVTDLAWIRELTGLAGFFMPCPVSVFSNTEFAGAVDWLRSLPEGAAISHRLLPESGVIVVEVKQALRAQDFDSLAFTADAWIEAHGDLRKPDAQSGFRRHEPASRQFPFKLRESDLPPLPLFIPVRRIIGDWCCSLHRGDATTLCTSTSSVGPSSLLRFAFYTAMLVWDSAHPVRWAEAHRG